MNASLSRPHLGPLNWLAIAFCVYGLTTTNPAETVWSFLTLYASIRLFLWKEYPPIALLAIGLTWIEVHFNLFEANSYSISMDELFFGTGQRTFWIASTGFWCMMLGLSWGLQKSEKTRFTGSQIQAAAQSVNPYKLIALLVLLTLLDPVVSRLFPYGSSLRQIGTYFNGIKLALLTAYCFRYFYTRQNHILFLAVVIGQIVLSLYSYFGSWKGILFVVTLAATSKLKELNTSVFLRLAPIAILGLSFTFLWQAIKPAYREFLMQEERAQVIRVDRIEALSKVGELSAAALENRDEIGGNVLASTYRRVGYLEYFASAVQNVPNEIPHENGKLLLSNLEYAIIPRILNPNKGVKDDKVKVEKYTDFYFGVNSISSFSLGHFCEAYIDWGWFGSCLQLLAYGFIGAGLWKLTLNRTRRLNPLLAVSIVYVVFHLWGSMQVDAIQLYGRVTWNTFCQLVLFFPAYVWINKFAFQESPEETSSPNPSH